MKILVVHQPYRVRGGEDVCVERELEALRQAGCDVQTFFPATASAGSTGWQALAAPWGAGALERQIASDRPDIVHAHNLLPFLTPRLFPTLRRQRIKTVLTLHNFRPLCLNGLFLTPQNEVCQRCVGTRAFGPGIIRGCYRGSRLQSAWMGLHLSAARYLGWYDAVDRFIAPSEFLKNQFIQGGFLDDRILIQGHFIPDTRTDVPQAPAGYVLYLGRLSEEKGIRWLLDQFVDASASGPILAIAGSGPLETLVRSRTSPRIQFHGMVQGSTKENLLRQAAAVVMASECFENFPLVILEANAAGVPALVPNAGGMAELVRPGLNGETYERRQSTSFRASLARILEPSAIMERRHDCQQQARGQFSRKHWIETRLRIYEALLS